MHWATVPGRCLGGISTTSHLKDLWATTILYNLEVLPTVALVIPLPGLAVVLHLVLTIADLLMTIVCFNSKRLLQL